MRWLRRLATITVAVVIATTGAVTPAHAAYSPNCPGGSQMNYNNVAIFTFWDSHRFYRGDGCSIGKSYLTMQSVDGNLVLYDEWGTARWAMSWIKYNAIAAGYADFQNDGNLVSYSYSGRALAATGSFKTSVPNWFRPILAVQADGNLVIYVQLTNGGLVPIWASNSAH